MISTVTMGMHGSRKLLWNRGGDLGRWLKALLAAFAARSWRGTRRLIPLRIELSPRAENTL